MSQPPPNPISRVHHASRAAASERAYWLLALAEDENIEAADLLRHAATPDGRPLLRLTLKQVLMADGRSEAAARRCVENILVRMGPHRRLPSNPTVGWLLDSRSDGSRLRVWADVVLVGRNAPPSPRFPWTPPHFTLGAPR